MAWQHVPVSRRPRALAHCPTVGSVSGSQASPPGPGAPGTHNPSDSQTWSEPLCHPVPPPPPPGGAQAQAPPPTTPREVDNVEEVRSIFGAKTVLYRTEGTGFLLRNAPMCLHSKCMQCPTHFKNTFTHLENTCVLCPPPYHPICPLLHSMVHVLRAPCPILHVASLPGQCAHCHCHCQCLCRYPHEGGPCQADTSETLNPPPHLQLWAPSATQ